MGQLTDGALPHEVVIEIGSMPIRIRTASLEFLAMLQQRYGGFLSSAPQAQFEFDVEIVPPRQITDEEDVSVHFESGHWILQRGDFYADCDPAERRGWVRQSANPYSIDAVLRIVHTLLLAPQGGFLLHASSAILRGRAFLFTGVSGAGKTTMSRLAPPEATLLTDEISYVCRQEGGYRAFGTPFAGDLGQPGENVSAPIGALYFLVKGSENRIEAVALADAARALLRNILFFAEDPELVNQVFRNACAFLAAVPAYRLTFLPSPEVWGLIG